MKRLLIFGVLGGWLPAAEADAGKALRLLLGAGDVRMNTPACQKTKPGGSTYTIREDLAERLATLHNGLNRVEASCTGQECTIRLSHREGEDVWSAMYRFRLTAKGAVVRESIECGWTP